MSIRELTQRQRDHLIHKIADAQLSVTHLVMSVPTSEVRNQVTIANIALMHAMMGLQEEAKKAANPVASVAINQREIYSSDDSDKAPPNYSAHVAYYLGGTRTYRYDPKHWDINETNKLLYAISPDSFKFENLPILVDVGKHVRP